MSFRTNWDCQKPKGARNERGEKRLSRIPCKAIAYRNLVIASEYNMAVGGGSVRSIVPTPSRHHGCLSSLTF